MRTQTIGIYLIIFCIIVSIGLRNESIVHIQLKKDQNNHIQVTRNQVKQNRFYQKSIIPKINLKQANNRTAWSIPKLQASKSIKGPVNSTGFISTWYTNITSPTSSNSYQVTLPLVSDGVYDFNVSWGDGNHNTITTYDQPQITHTYKSSGFYTVNITGTIIGWMFNGTGDALKLFQISNWGPLRLGNTGYYFSGASNLYLTTKNALNLTGTTNLEGMFENCYELGTSGDLNSWNVSQVTNMANMFKISDVYYLYSHVTSFNQPLDSWNVSQVTDMSAMFFGEVNFDQPLDSWNVSQVTKMSSMFELAIKFDQPLNSWDVSQVTNMNDMFNRANDFNQPLNSWDVSRVTDMSDMFNRANDFNQSLNSWNVSRVTNMRNLFWYVTNFNQPLNSWDVSRVTDMNSMFSEVINFNQPLNSWNVSRVTDMSGMFDEAINFNQPLNSWNVTRVTDMSGMFYNATNFNQPLNLWDVSKVTDMSHMFTNISLSIQNYNKLLLDWSSLPNLEHFVVFDAGSSQYTSSVQYARKKLVNNFGWNITDGGIVLDNLSSFKSIEIIGLTVIGGVIAFVCLVNVYLLIEYKKINRKLQFHHLKFWFYLQNKIKTKKENKTYKETLSNETFNKLEHIIDENREKY